MARKVEISAGILVFRRRDGIEVLLAHPGGPYWARKDEGAWSIPKGLVESSADLLATAQREFAEETGLIPVGRVIALAPVEQRSGKIVHSFAVEADLDLAEFCSNTFEIEWPPKSGRQKCFPEVDRIAYFAVATALRKILPYQRPLIEQLLGKLGGNEDARRP
jgi:predicted NUDIX family NTP pyrophosphohydrolase